MKRKKQFVSPRVLCQVEVCLEGDLLILGQSTEHETEVSIPGIEVVETDAESDLIDVFYD